MIFKIWLEQNLLQKFQKMVQDIILINTHQGKRKEYQEKKRIKNIKLSSFHPLTSNLKLQGYALHIYYINKIW